MAISAEHNKFVYPDYISALPADIYIQGAVKRQDMYDEGRLKIQNQIDTFSQIQNQLVKPVDKQYFEKEMGNLLKEINKNVGLDFSVKGNFNAVMNIGKPLENNSYIRGAIKSSSNYNKMMEEYQSLPSDQRGSANDYFFMKNINSWMSDETPGSQLNYSSYIPYGIDKKVYGELMKDLKPTTETVIGMDETGRYIEKQVISGVSAGRFQDAYLAAIGEAGVRQLQMDAQYQIETKGKNNIAVQYLADQALYADGLKNELLSLQDKLKVAVEREGTTGPNSLRIKNSIDDLSKRQNITLSKLNQNPENIDESTLVQFVIGDNLRNTSGAYAYQSLEKELEADPYALEQYKTNLSIAANAAKEQTKFLYDLERDARGLSSAGDRKLKEPPAGAQLTSSSLIGDSPQVYESDTLINAARTPETYNRFVAGFAKHIADFSYTQDPTTGQVNVTGEGKRNVKEALQKVASENTWDQVTTYEVHKALGGGALAENFYWKMKGLASKLGVLDDATITANNLNRNVTIKDGVTTVNKTADNNTTLIVNYSVPGFQAYSKKIKVGDFLKLPASELLYVQSINTESSTLK
jgi:hypothetical protein